MAQSRSLIVSEDVADPLLLPDASMPEIDADLLASFLVDRKSHRVGYYFEALLLFWLQHVRGVEIEGAGIQIRDGKRTVGELDLLFRDEAGRLTHWEASVKFFLHHPNTVGSHFPGPNARDSFEAKMTKLFDQQLPLSIEHRPEVTVRQACVKGAVFYHPAVARPVVLPDRMAADHGTGWWIRSSELALLDAGEWDAGAVAQKPHWLGAPPTEDLMVTTELVAHLRAHFAAVGHPVMVWLMKGVTDSRLFVVGDMWPEHHASGSSGPSEGIAQPARR